LSFYALVGDIGGTNARFALIEKDSVVLHHVAVLSCKDYDNFDTALQHYYQQCGVSPVEHACISFACPIEEEIRMTNNHWAFNLQQMQQKLELKQFKLLNDFTAMAYGTLYVEESEKILIQKGTAHYNTSPRLVIGPGTGLGVSSLIPGNDASNSALSWQATATEGGHISFAAQNELEVKILGKLQQRYQRVSAERILSGSGIVALYQVLCDINNVAVQFENAAQVTQAALADGDNTDAIALLTLKKFCEILGAVVGDIALAQGARGGIYLCGGILPRIQDFFINSQFSQSMCNKGRMSNYLSEIPVWLCDAKYPGLVGAAGALKFA
jgi:glucokinase